MSRNAISKWSIALSGVLVVVGVTVLPNQRLSAYVNGAPSGYSGAPSESTCVGCHSGSAVNSGTATFSIALASPTFVPSTPNAVTVAFTNTTNVKHGFEITARDINNTAVGSWTVTQIGKTRNTSSSAFHHEQTSSGATQGSWTMNWVGPATLPHGPVTFYACGLDANNNGSTSGDRVYTKTKKLYQASLTATTTTWPINTIQTLTLAAPGHAGEHYLIAVSDDITPVSFGSSMMLEVNSYTGFTAYALRTPAVFTNFYATLDANGGATGIVHVPNLPSLHGLPLHFAALTANASFVPSEVSNRVDIVFN